METADQKRMVARGALFFALALLFQSLRLLFPLPPLAGMFLIGSLVNMALILALRFAGFMPAAAMGMLLPCAAFMQGQLLIPLLIPVVAVGNFVMLVCCRRWDESRFLWLTPVVKMLVLYGGAYAVVRCFSIPPRPAAVILAMMSWPHLVTTTLGIVIAGRISRRLSAMR